MIGGRLWSCHLALLWHRCPHEALDSGLLGPMLQGNTLGGSCDSQIQRYSNVSVNLLRFRDNEADYIPKMNVVSAAPSLLAADRRFLGVREVRQTPIHSAVCWEWWYRCLIVRPQGWAGTRWFDADAVSVREPVSLQRWTSHLCAVAFVFAGALVSLLSLSGHFLSVYAASCFHYRAIFHRCTSVLLSSLCLFPLSRGFVRAYVGVFLVRNRVSLPTFLEKKSRYWLLVRWTFEFFFFFFGA